MDTKAQAPSTLAGGRWSNFSISGKLMSTWALPLLRRCGHHLRQAVQGLRAEHQIDVGRALDDGFAFLGGHAAAHADQQIRIGALELLQPAQVGKHFFLGFFAHGAGVEQDDVGVFRRVGADQAIGGAQDVGHLVRVVLVHLAAEGFDEDFFLHEIA